MLAIHPGEEGKNPDHMLGWHIIRNSLMLNHVHSL